MTQHARRMSQVLHSEASYLVPVLRGEQCLAEHATIAWNSHVNHPINVAKGRTMTCNIRLEDLASQIPVISEPVSAAYTEACMVCFDLHNHRAGISLDVTFVEVRHEVAVHWGGQVTEWMRRTHADLNKRVDDGTSSIALLLLSRFANLVAVEVSQKYNGIDYFLSSPDDEDYDEEHLIFNHKAVLEISGIQTERGSNTITSRLNIKKKRLEDYRNSSTSLTIDLPTYICVVEFSDPEALVVLV